MEKTLLILYIIGYSITAFIGFLWYKNPMGNYGPPTVILTAISTILLSIEKFRSFKKRSKYDPAKIDEILKIHDSIKNFIAEIQQLGTIDYNKLTSLLQETKHVTVLFKDKEIEEYISNLHNKGSYLKLIEGQMQRTTPNTQQRDEKLTEIANLFNWFCAQHEIVENMFRPYLNK